MTMRTGHLLRSNSSSNARQNSHKYLTLLALAAFSLMVVGCNQRAPAPIAEVPVPAALSVSDINALAGASVGLSEAKSSTSPAALDEAVGRILNQGAPVERIDLNK
jgi:hypothetical protein